MERMKLWELADLSLREREYRALLYLSKGEASLGEVMEALGFSMAGAYRALSPLVQRGLVEKANGLYRLAIALEFP
ncbi:helix-turn-helix domain-containing protein [Thermus sediminis]|uniref:helix-turn-helix domain-containing protein n=1 Tax=Thermus sediminis TaxID=1761908 RepID=UPI000E3C0EE3|nr:helix-turn-helix domain-containing protein [Thermus sediminis]